MKHFQRLVEALLLGAPGCEFPKRCAVVLPVRCYLFGKERQPCCYLTKRLEGNGGNAPKPCKYVSLAAAGDVVLFMSLLSSAIRQAGSSGG